MTYIIDISMSSLYTRYNMQCNGRLNRFEYKSEQEARKDLKKLKEAYPETIYKLQLGILDTETGETIYLK